MSTIIILMFNKIITVRENQASSIYITLLAMVLLHSK